MTLSEKAKRAAKAKLKREMDKLKRKLRHKLKIDEAKRKIKQRLCQHWRHTHSTGRNGKTCKGCGAPLPW